MAKDGKYTTKNNQTTLTMITNDHLSYRSDGH